MTFDEFCTTVSKVYFFLTSGLVLGLRIKVGPVECTKVRSYQNTAFTKKIFHSFSMIISNFVAFSEFINFTRILQKHLDAITTFMQFRFKSIIQLLKIGVQSLNSMNSQVSKQIQFQR